MAWSVEWDGGFVVGGDGQRRLTPSFRLREVTRADGSVRIHRELVSALQMLRDELGGPVKVHDVGPDGLAALVEAEPAAALAAAGETLVKARVLDATTAEGTALRVRIPDPAALPAVDLEQVLSAAFSVTAGFETSGDRFQQVTGNFDGAGLSFGPAQVNFGTGTLPPLFAAFREADEGALRAAFSDPTDYEEWLQVLERPVAEQISWADGISTGRGKSDVVEPWKGYLQAVGRVPAFRTVMVEHILTKYGRALLREVDYLSGLRPQIEVDHLRCICSLYDLVVQQGSLDKAHEAIEARVASEGPADQFALVRIAVEERAKTANSRFVADCMSRRLGILEGVPRTVEDTQRANVNFYLLRDVRLAGASALRTADVSAQLDRVSGALATGSSLLA
jgi:hypothetical protein